MKTIVYTLVVTVFASLFGVLTYSIGYQTAERETSKVFTSKFTHLNPCAIDHVSKQRIVSGAVDTVYGGDYFGDILYTNPDGTEETLPDLQNFPPPFHFRAKSATPGPVTFRPAEGTIDGKAGLTIKQGECVEIHARKDHYEAYLCDEPHWPLK